VYTNLPDDAQIAVFVCILDSEQGGATTQELCTIYGLKDLTPRFWLNSYVNSLSFPLYEFRMLTSTSETSMIAEGPRTLSLEE